jgi:hypothetical protein
MIDSMLPVIIGCAIGGSTGGISALVIALYLLRKNRKLTPDPTSKIGDNP